MIVPRTLSPIILRQMHDGLLSGHLGRKKTREKLVQGFYWYGVHTNVDLHVARCDERESIKPPGRSIKAPLGKMMVGAPMDHLGADVLGPLPKTPRGR